MVKIKTGKSLKELLNLIAKESVLYARKSIMNEQENEKEDEVFTGEEEEDEVLKEPEEEEKEEEEPSKEKEEEKKQQQPQKVDKSALDLYPASPQQVDIRMVTNKINAIRAGRSTDSVQEDLQDYLNRLDRDEKNVLASFLSSIGAIMSGQIEGSKIPNPEESLDVEIMTDKEMEDLKRPRKKVVIGDEEEGRESEDFSPPIQVRSS